MRGWVRCALVLCVLAGCRQLFGIDPTEVDGDGPAADADPDEPDGSGVDGSACFGTGLERVCLGQFPVLPVVLPDMLIDTDGSASCQVVVSATTPACVIAGAQVTITGRVRAIGSRPLVLVGGRIELGVAAIIDVSSPRGDVPGAGAPSVIACATGLGATDSGGGAGGSFGATGGNGGDGASGGSPGLAGPPVVPSTVRGGCAGGAGGNSPADQAGAGGGAVYLIAASEIRLDGVIDASGGGGAGGVPPERGGSGGGAGGYIGVDAPFVAISPTGRIFANGGGGGEGAGIGSFGGTGTESVLPQNPGQGGSGGNDNAGDGGDGGFVSGAADGGGNGQSSAAGGGGGGSVGVIQLFAPAVMDAGDVSPPPS